MVVLGGGAVSYERGTPVSPKHVCIPVRFLPKGSGSAPEMVVWGGRDAGDRRGGTGANAPLARFAGAGHRRGERGGESEGARGMPSGTAKYGSNHGAAGVAAAAPAPPYPLLRLRTSDESTCLSTTPLAATSFRVTHPVPSDENPPSFQPGKSVWLAKNGVCKTPFKIASRSRSGGTSSFALTNRGSCERLPQR